jgi:hypothetical protein
MESLGGWYFSPEKTPYRHLHVGQRRRSQTVGDRFDQQHRINRDWISGHSPQAVLCTRSARLYPGSTSTLFAGFGKGGCVDCAQKQI